LSNLRCAVELLVAATFAVLLVPDDDAAAAATVMEPLPVVSPCLVLLLPTTVLMASVDDLVETEVVSIVPELVVELIVRSAAAPGIVPLGRIVDPRDAISSKGVTPSS